MNHPAPPPTSAPPVMRQEGQHPLPPRRPLRELGDPANNARQLEHPSTPSALRHVDRRDVLREYFIQQIRQEIQNRIAAEEADLAELQDTETIAFRAQKRQMRASKADLERIVRNAKKRVKYHNDVVNSGNTPGRRSRVRTPHSKNAAMATSLAVPPSPLQGRGPESDQQGEVQNLQDGVQNLQDGVQNLQTDVQPRQGTVDNPQAVSSMGGCVYPHAQRHLRLFVKTIWEVCRFYPPPMAKDLSSDLVWRLSDVDTGGCAVPPLENYEAWDVNEDRDDTDAAHNLMLMFRLVAPYIDDLDWWLGTSFRMLEVQEHKIVQQAYLLLYRELLVRADGVGTELNAWPFHAFAFFDAVAVAFDAKRKASIHNAYSDPNVLRHAITERWRRYRTGKTMTMEEAMAMPEYLNTPPPEYQDLLDFTAFYQKRQDCHLRHQSTVHLIRGVVSTVWKVCNFSPPADCPFNDVDVRRWGYGEEWHWQAPQPDTIGLLPLADPFFLSDESAVKVVRLLVDYIDGDAERLLIWSFRLLEVECSPNVNVWWAEELYDFPDHKFDLPPFRLLWWIREIARAWRLARRDELVANADRTETEWIKLRDEAGWMHRKIIRQDRIINQEFMEDMIPDELNSAMTKYQDRLRSDEVAATHQAQRPIPLDTVQPTVRQTPVPILAPVHTQKEKPPRKEKPVPPRGPTPERQSLRPKAGPAERLDPPPFQKPPSQRKRKAHVLDGDQAIPATVIPSGRAVIAPPTEQGPALPPTKRRKAVPPKRPSAKDDSPPPKRPGRGRHRGPARS
ncbi:hypothetical protein LTR22_025751 [Elasticomyces elasticus]|nr:hypothetical protein LTR22_025751 [Elasticomyces elasticus]